MSYAFIDTGAEFKARTSSRPPVVSIDGSWPGLRANALLMTLMTLVMTLAVAVTGGRSRKIRKPRRLTPVIRGEEGVAKMQHNINQ